MGNIRGVIIMEQVTIFGNVECEKVKAIKRLQVRKRKIKTYGTNWICVEPKLKKKKTYVYLCLLVQHRN